MDRVPTSIHQPQSLLRHARTTQEESTTQRAQHALAAGNFLEASENILGSSLGQY